MNLQNIKTADDCADMLNWRRTELARKLEAGETVPRMMRAEIHSLATLLADMQSPQLFQPKIPITINKNENSKHDSIPR